MYQLTNKNLWQGRTDSNDVDSLRYHQAVELINIIDLPKNENALSMVGFACDEGVRRNKGRVGAGLAPDALRKSMASIPWRMPTATKLYDTGTIACEGNALEVAQQQLGNHVVAILQQDMPCVVLGGGHETLYGHYLGLRNFYGANTKIGIINIDAHFDLRDYSEQTSSGTMFKQILDTDAQANYFVLGIQRFGNTSELFKRADALGVTYVYADEMANYAEQVEAFIAQQDVILLTLCTDVIDIAYAPGVSAPAIFGLLPNTVREIIRLVTSNDKTMNFNICEVNPLLDEADKTTKLGAQLVNEVIYTMAKRCKR